MASRSEVTRRMREQLIPLVEEWQGLHPDRLLARGYLCQQLAMVLDVTRQGMSRWVGDAVANGKLLEIFPLPDWRVELPEGKDLPQLYAMPHEKYPHMHQLQYEKPQSRGAGQISFLITPRSLAVLLPMVRKQLGLPEPDDSEFYDPVIERRVRPAVYGQLMRVLIANSPVPLTASQAADILEPVLGTLRLKAPTT